MLRCFRMLRSVRALRLLNVVHSIRQLILAANASLGTVLSSFGLFMIFVIGYAVMGVPVFHDVKRAYALTRQANMDTVKGCIEILMRTAAGEDWPALMHDLSVQAPTCTIPPDQSWISFYAERIMSPGLGVRGDCGSNFAYPYFIFFSFLCKFAFLPLFAASMVSTFLEHVGQFGVLSTDDVALYSRIWEQLDRKRTGSLSAWKLKALVDGLHAAGSVVSFDTVRMPARLEKARMVLKVIQCSGPSFLARVHNQQQGVPSEAAASAHGHYGQDAGKGKTASEGKTASGASGLDRTLPFAERDRETETAAQRAKVRAPMVMSFDQVLTMLVVLKFFEEAVQELAQEEGHDSGGGTVGVVRQWARVANAQAMRLMLFRQSGGTPAPHPCCAGGIAGPMRVPMCT